jgi:uncharacterized membrane protein YqjE
MATDIREEQAPSVTTLASGIVQDLQDLVKHQFELFKHEIRDEVRQVKVASLALAAAGCVALVGLLLLGITLSLGLSAIAPTLPLWASFAIVTVAFLLCGGGLCALGLVTLNRVNPIDNDSTQAFKENVQWITKQK